VRARSSVPDGDRTAVVVVLARHRVKPPVACGPPRRAAMTRQSSSRPTVSGSALVADAVWQTARHDAALLAISLPVVHSRRSRRRAAPLPPPDEESRRQLGRSADGLRTRGPCPPGFTGRTSRAGALQTPAGWAPSALRTFTRAPARPLARLLASAGRSRCSGRCREAGPGSQAPRSSAS